MQIVDHAILQPVPTQPKSPLASPPDVATVRTARLAARLDLIGELLAPARRIAYIDYPVHENIGDLMIAAGTELLFAELGLEVAYRASILDFDAAELRAALPEGPILCHGGGNMNALYPWHDGLRLNVLAAFPDRRVILLPQSVDYAFADGLPPAIAALRAHPYAVVCVRDRVSEALLAPHLAGRVHLLPDMAHRLRGRLPDAAAEPGRVLRLFRRDEEALGGAPAESIDWGEAIRGVAALRWRAGRRLGRAVLRHRLLPPQLRHRPWAMTARRVVDDAARFLATHERVETDRLHAMILATLMGRPVAHGDNSFGKLGRYHDTWLNDWPEVMRLSAAA